MTKTAPAIIPEEYVASKIYVIRGQKVMLDNDLAMLYGVETKVLNQAVKRNISRFPEDFMFQLSKDELSDWRSQIVTSNPKAKMGLRRAPYVFTEHGALMLSSVLKSQKAVEMSLLIVRTFVKLREVLAAHEDIARKIEEHDQHIANLYAHLEKILKFNTPKKNPMGYIWDTEKEW